MNNEKRFIELATLVYKRHKSVILIPSELVLVRDRIAPISKPKFDTFEEFACFFAYKNNGVELHSTGAIYNSGEIERLVDYLKKDKDFAEMLSMDINVREVVERLLEINKERSMNGTNGHPDTYQNMTILISG